MALAVGTGLLLGLVLVASVRLGRKSVDVDGRPLAAASEPTPVSAAGESEPPPPAPPAAPSAKAEPVPVQAGSQEMPSETTKLSAAAQGNRTPGGEAKAESPDEGTKTAASKGSSTSGRSSSKTAAREPASDWMQDYPAAQALAAKEHKDLLLIFIASGQDNDSTRMAEELLLKGSLRSRLGAKYVLVLIDFPKKGSSSPVRVEDSSRNSRLAKTFSVDKYPTVFVSDSAGWVFGQFGYVGGGMTAFQGRLAELRPMHDELQAISNKAESNSPSEVFDALRRGVNLLEDKKLTRYNGPLLRHWLEQARKHDENNTKACMSWCSATRGCCG